MSLSLFGLCFVPITITNASHVTMNKCDSNSYDSCVNNWECMWCNYSTIENNTIIHKENCNYLIKNDLIFGCGKPFRIITNNSTYIAIICDYI